MNKVRFEQMVPGELEELVAERPLAWLPVGMLEWHGRHLPVGLDALKAHALCCRIAENAGGAVLPADYYSILGMVYPWTFRYNPSLFSKKVFTTLRSLRKYGFKNIFIITGHYPVAQVLLLIGIAEAFMATHDAAVVALPEFALASEIGYNGDHAAMWETSIMMELCPELVDKKELENISGLSSLSLFRKGVYGANPGDNASREKGKEAVDVMVRNFAELADRLADNPDKNIAREVHRDFARNHFRTELDKITSTISRNLDI